MQRILHTRIRLGGGRRMLPNVKRVQVACLGATACLGLIMLAVRIFE